MVGATAPKRIESHRDLVVWQKSMDLVVQVYRLTAAFPPNEMYRLVVQATRSARLGSRQYSRRARSKQSKGLGEISRDCKRFPDGN